MFFSGQLRGCLKELSPHPSMSRGAATEGAEGAGPCHSRAVCHHLGNILEFVAGHQELLEVLSSLKFLRIPQFALWNMNVFTVFITVVFSSRNDEMSTL